MGVAGTQERKQVDHSLLIKSIFSPLIYKRVYSDLWQGLLYLGNNCSVWGFLSVGWKHFKESPVCLAISMGAFGTLARRELSKIKQVVE